MAKKITKEQGRKLIQASDRLWKRAKRPQNYDAMPADIDEINRLIEDLRKAIGKIKRKN
jgi:hypothetical protein